MAEAEERAAQLVAAEEASRARVARATAAARAEASNAASAVEDVLKAAASDVKSAASSVVDAAESAASTVSDAAEAAVSGHSRGFGQKTTLESLVAAGKLRTATVRMLKKLCADHGLKQTGRKSDLIDRLATYAQNADKQ